MKEIDKSELTEEVLKKIAAGGSDASSYVTKCCRKPATLDWSNYYTMRFVCSGCGKVDPEIIYVG